VARAENPREEARNYFKLLSALGKFIAHTLDRKGAAAATVPHFYSFSLDQERNY